MILPSEQTESGQRIATLRRPMVGEHGVPRLISRVEGQRESIANIRELGKSRREAISIQNSKAYEAGLTPGEINHSRPRFVCDPLRPYRRVYIASRRESSEENRPDKERAAYRDEDVAQILTMEQRWELSTERHGKYIQKGSLR